MGSQAEFDAITGELRAGRLLPEVDAVFPLGRGREAYERLGSGLQFGKVVVDIGTGDPVVA
jgi:NADPH:quinone reductase-like Zn-dependent oxidoreductase